MKKHLRNQTPINSQFNASSTTAEVLHGLILRDKTAIVTGGYSGLGFETTQALALSGVSVIVGARNVLAAQEKLAGMPNVVIKPLDLSDLDSVKEFSDGIVNSGIRVDMLICNAGIMACPEQRVGKDWESQFATNHIGHYALTNLIWSTLKPGARIVCVSSAGHHNSCIRWDDIHFHRSPYDKWIAYGQSKTANALFALQLNEYGKKFDIQAFSLHPGKIRTPLQRHLSIEEMYDAGWTDMKGNVIDPTFKTLEQGAATQLWAATSPKLKSLGGLYLEDCEVASPAESQGTFVGVCDFAVDLGEAQKLWDYTAKLTHIDAFKISSKP